MEGFGIHSSIWTMDWTPEAAEHAIGEAVRYKFDFVEVAVLNPKRIDAKHTRRLLEKVGMRAVGSLGLPEGCWLSKDTDAGVAFLKAALDCCAAMGAEALSGVVYGGIGERTGVPPTEIEYANIARGLTEAAAHASKLGLQLGIEPVNRYESHLINTGWQGVAMIEKVGAANLFLHLDTYHMNIEEKGAGNGIIAGREHLRYIHLSESDRGTPGAGTCDWDEIFATLKAVGFKGGLAMESFINMPPELAYGLAVWRPVAGSREEVIEEGLPFLRNKARQYGLMSR
jgi:D-psicose/D-tagatose/L-ribulose 3-epimerase